MKKYMCFLEFYIYSEDGTLLATTSHNKDFTVNETIVEKDLDLLLAINMADYMYTTYKIKVLDPNLLNERLPRVKYGYTEIK